MNKVIMIGRTTKEIDLRTTNNGKTVATFSLAVPKQRREDGTDYFDCVAWGKLGELIERYVGKGHRIAVSGRLSKRSYTDKNGNSREVTEIVCDDVEFLQEKPKETSKQAETEIPSVSMDFESDDDEELPF